ncbi:MAG: NGG1p interacting factor NIF3 [Candidatus Aminicenantes bacterium]|nr:NGG1p interacting factor NIF3 [Candidatus Aminicenantes bacterium]
MKLERLYRKAVEVGIARDLRGEEEIARLLAEEAERHKDLKDEEKAFYDPDRLFNPFADSRILNGDPAADVRIVLAGIDIEVGELLIARLLNKEEGGKIDLVVSHHPMGSALLRLHEVMKLQSRLLAKYGVTISVAEQLMEKRIGEVERRLLPINAAREVDAARILGLPLVCLHTPADNCVTHFLAGLFEEEKPRLLKDLVKILRGIPEYERSVRLQAPPKVVSGSEMNSCGKIFVDMTGGTEGAKDIFDKIAAGGVSTLVCMHVSEDHLANAKKANLNVVIAGHIASDTLGLNLLLDEIEKEERLEFVCLGGFERIRRP